MIARIKFKKIASSKFIGHLDMIRYFQKAFKRANLDVTYSQGFNPHQLITFAAPLGVGLTSDGEYLDLTLNSSEKPQVMIDKINKAMASNIIVTDFKILPKNSKNAMSIVAGADYLVSLKEGYDFLEKDAFENKFLDFIKQDNIIITKKTKKSERKIDIKPFIYHYEFNEKNKRPSIYLRLATGSANNLKAELVMEAFYNYVDLTYNKFAFQIHRMDTLKVVKDGDTEKLVPLNFF